VHDFLEHGCFRSKRRTVVEQGDFPEKGWLPSFFGDLDFQLFHEVNGPRRPLVQCEVTVVRWVPAQLWPRIARPPWWKTGCFHRFTSLVTSLGIHVHFLWATRSGLERFKLGVVASLAKQGRRDPMKPCMGQERRLGPDRGATVGTSASSMAWWGFDRGTDKRDRLFTASRAARVNSVGHHVELGIGKSGCYGAFMNAPFWLVKCMRAMEGIEGMEGMFSTYPRFISILLTTYSRSYGIFWLTRGV